MEFSISGNAISANSVKSKSNQSSDMSQCALPPIGRRPSGSGSGKAIKPKPETTSRAIGSRERKMSGAGGVSGSSMQVSSQGSARRGSRDISSRESDQGSSQGSARRPAGGVAKPTKMQRAKYWSPEVENLFRFQAAGFRDANEYTELYDVPEQWESNGFVKRLQVKSSGYFMYFRQERECADKYLNKIKIYSY